MVAVNSTQDYLIYPNESVDKLTVNRPLSNLHALLKGLDESDGTLSVDNADEEGYGLVRRSRNESYDFSMTGDEDFTSAAMTIPALEDFATRQYTSSEMSEVVRSAAESEKDAIRLSLGSTKVLNMPNGNMMVVLAFDVGFDGLHAMFGDEAVDNETAMPVRDIDGYGCYVVKDATTSTTISGHGVISGFVENSNIPEYSFPVPVDGRVHFNGCRWLSRSSYRQTRVEVKFQATVSVKGIFTELYGYREERMYTVTESTPTLSGTPSKTYGTYPNRYAPYAHKPVVIAQVASYVDGSRPQVLAGTLGGSEEEARSDAFFEEDVLTEKPLTSTTAADPSGDGTLELPVVEGCVIPKNFHNIYRPDGRIDDNSITLDVSLKFTAGGPDDPDSSRMKRSCSGKASVGVVMIGVRDEG